MSGTFSQLHIQIVFAVHGRENVIGNAWRTELHKYIAGIITAKEQKSIIVNGARDHIHAFVGVKPTMRISDLVRDIKNNSSNFINKERFTLGKFSWQEGYGAFSYSRSQVDKVFAYIQNQEEHHRVHTFKEEYHAFLDKFQIEYNDKYLFQWIE